MVGHVAAAAAAGVGVGVQEWCVQWIRRVVCGAHDFERGGGRVGLLWPQVFNHVAGLLRVLCMCVCRS